MAQKSFSSLPDAIRKRDLLHSPKSSPETLKSYGKQFEDAGAWSDAIDFYAQAKDWESLKALRQKAAVEGNSFLILKVAKFLTDDKAGLDADLQTSAEKAESMGKLRYAIKAHDRLENLEKAESLRQQIGQDGDIQAEFESRVFIPLHNEEEAEAEEV